MCLVELEICTQLQERVRNNVRAEIKSGSFNCMLLLRKSLCFGIRQATRPSLRWTNDFGRVGETYIKVKDEYP